LAFAEAYGLERFVQCRTRVTRVEPLSAAGSLGTALGCGASDANGVGPETSAAALAADSTGPAANGSDPAATRRWRVTSEPTADDARLSPVTVVAAPDAARHRESEEFEAVVVCNGHYSEPRLPPDSGPPLARLAAAPIFGADYTALHALQNTHPVTASHASCRQCLLRSQAALEQADLQIALRDPACWQLTAYLTTAGAEVFPSTVMHTHSYREPSPFAGQRVVVVGASASGVDISREIATVAKKVRANRSLYAPRQPRSRILQIGCLAAKTRT